MYRGLDLGTWRSAAGRKRWSEGGGLKRMRRVPGSVWGSGVLARPWWWDAGTHFERMRDEVWDWPSEWAVCVSLLEQVTARWWRRVIPMEWKHAME